ncbi:prephenate dehydratase [Desulforhabdus amnigena]|jgi:chorismate mutase/prephenate dehydratase|nr:prephenate dehydratase [Desulforhabdus amnigena]
MIVEDRLTALREAIDEVDTELLKLLNKRMELACEVGRFKAEKGVPLFHPGREELIFERLTKANPGPIAAESLRAIYREIFAASRLLQYVLQVAYLGPEWTYSHLAALSLYGHSARYIPCSTLEDVFEAVLKGKVHVAVIPIENSLQGGVGRSMDLLYESEMRVVGECYLEIAHNLCSTSSSIADLKHLYAHPQAIEQCRRWILGNLRHVEIYESTSTAQAAQMAKKDPIGAAICNLYAAHHYGLNILADRIEDQAGNTTRFLALSSQLNPPTGSDKTSLLFAVSDQPGALHAALEAFSDAHVNMTRIESRPNRLFPWQYLFYADIEGHVEDENVHKALDELRTKVTFLKVLGSYPKRDPKLPIRFEKEKLRQSDRQG